VVKRTLYRVLKKSASLSFNILNICLAGNLPPLGCIAVIVEDQGRYLLLRRPEGGLVFPGGFIRWREHPVQTAEREFKEETGLQVKLRHVFACYSNTSASFDSMSTMTLVYCGEMRGGEMRKSIEGQPCWIEEAKLRSIIDFRYKCMLDDYREHCKLHDEQQNCCIQVREVTNEKL
jgi:ADP-ribose pyrophosphatase YjhB (NUDIX family)